jgi:hypothetical protein
VANPSVARGLIASLHDRSANSSINLLAAYFIRLPFAGTTAFHLCFVLAFDKWGRPVSNSRRLTWNTAGDTFSSNKQRFAFSTTRYYDHPAQT